MTTTAMLNVGKNSQANNTKQPTEAAYLFIQNNQGTKILIRRKIFAFGVLNLK